ncbi:MAG: alanine--tRNA ligase [Desulfobacteraceae bacterium]|nr:alanine--tRNA ligase [Desulfobacteraceae bacterium]
MTGNEVRKVFLDYFHKHGHQIVRSSSLVPADDPTLLFTNAGMVQFKRTFLGEEKRDYNRATTSQKCVRAGGKHNDLENVGYTARHHTFFEMLGNFSFGDYFKEKAVEFGWDLLTNGYGLPADQLWVSIYLDDDEAAEIWNRNIGVPEERIVRFGEKDNFWAMGDTGPCGPCSEIHLDRGPEYGCGRPDCKLGCECDRYLEIWNLVFMQFNRDASGELTPLPRPSIDTGLGLERMVSVLQDVPTNFDIDLIRPIIGRTEELSGIRFGEKSDADVAMKVIADHSRAAAFLIGDGVLPSNEGRGYVLRRIMRRAIRYGRNIGLTRPFLHKTADVVFEIMKPAYPELIDGKAYITGVIRNEEQRFSETLDKGLKLLTETLSEMEASGQGEVSGDVVFKLYDTFGFPVDIVRDVVRDRNFTIDMEGFDRAMEDQRARSRTVTAFTGVGDAYKGLAAEGVKADFTGYEHLTGESRVLLLAVDGSEVEAASGGDTLEMVTERTPFYAESGGQVGDRGTITAGHGGTDAAFAMDITETVKDPTGIIIHKGVVRSGSVRKGDTVTLSVDEEARRATASNHTATHLLHDGLRRVLGDHVKQSGSLVAPDRFRFDFTHFSQIDRADLERIERYVNRRIRQNVPVHTDEMDADDAFRTGATALFEEKYGDRVRVVSLADFSKELCGGTHAQRTGDIGLFKIVQEASIASGVRRIEAVTGEAALKFVQERVGWLQEAARRMRDRPESLVQRLEALLKNQKMMEKEVDRLKAQLAAKEAGSTADEIRTVNGVQLLVKQVSVDSPTALRDLADRFRDRIGSGIVVLASAADGKVLLVVEVTQDLTDRYPAGSIIKPIAGMVGGGGGGRPDMAQAGGTKPENIDAALEKAVEVVEGM